MIDKLGYIDGDFFHAHVNKVYAENIGSVINKKNESMAKVIYKPAHVNNEFKEGDSRRGRGVDYATWIFSEENQSAENIFCGGLELMIDAFFEADSAIGLHTHYETEEVYYIISGSMKMTTVSKDGKEHDFLLEIGDAHAVRKGESHYGVAGSKGCRAIVVAVR